MYNPGIDVRFNRDRFCLEYGPGVVGPETEVRTLESIRSSLRDPAARGPEKLYAIGMDIYRRSDKDTMEEQMLLLGVVAYNAGSIGNEFVRSQGHIHAVSGHSQSSPPEIFEIWEGTAVIYMQESAKDSPGACYAVTAGPGDWVIVPPGWPHMVANASTDEPMVFGAICDRGYQGFEYDDVRDHGGLAFFPIVGAGGRMEWEKNPAYTGSTLTEKGPSDYSDIPGFDRPASRSLYQAAVDNGAALSFVPYPEKLSRVWDRFVP